MKKQKTLEEKLSPMVTLKRFEEMMELIKKYPLRASDYIPPPQYYKAEDKTVSYR